ncbi:MAG: AI-2E family transporter [Candidatus Cloacimonetes bacterium]|nr:AI-2E family transporter [Candidatus Cloacimonadota bacterium]
MSDKSNQPQKSRWISNNLEQFLQGFLQVVFSREFLICASLFVLLATFVSLFSAILAPFIVAFILAYILNPAVRFLMKYGRMGREYAVPLLFVLVSFGFLAFLIPFTLQLASGINSMAAEIIKIEYRPLVGKWREEIIYYKNEKMPESVRTALETPLENLKQYEDKLLEMISGLRDSFGRALKSLGNSMISLSNVAMKRTMDILLIPILLFYMLLDFDRVYPLFLSLVPSRYRPWTNAFLSTCDKTLRNFLFGQFLVALIYGLLMTLGLLAIGIKFSLVIGPLSGIANLIPYLGVIFSLGPVVGLAIYQGATGDGVLWMLSLVGIHYTIVQLIDGFFLQPKIIGENVELHPLVVMLALFIGGEVGGIYGMVFAVPAAALLKVLFSELYSVLYERKSRLLNRSFDGEKT